MHITNITDCYIAGLYVGIPLVVFSWLGQLSIILIYKFWKDFITSPNKSQDITGQSLKSNIIYAGDQQDESDNDEISEDTEDVDDEMNEDSGDGGESESDSGQSLGNPNEDLTSSSTITTEDESNHNSSSTPLEPVIITDKVAVQQELAGKNLGMSSMSEMHKTMMALAPLAKQRVEESDLPDSQKQILLSIMNSMSGISNISNISEMPNIDALFQGNQSGNILDD